MNRRNFIKILSALPFLGFLKDVKAEESPYDNLVREGLVVQNDNAIKRICNTEELPDSFFEHVEKQINECKDPYCIMVNLAGWDYLINNRTIFLIYKYSHNHRELVEVRFMGLPVMNFSQWHPVNKSVIPLSCVYTKEEYQSFTKSFYKEEK